MSGCSAPEDTFDYDALYRTQRTEAYAPVAPGSTNKASYGYTCASEQGYNDWYYLYGADGQYARMTYSGDSWRGGGAEIRGEVMRPALDAGAVRQYRVQSGGSAVLYGNYKCAEAGGAAAAVRVYQNETLLYEGVLRAGDTVGVYFSVAVTLSAGDDVYFEVTGKDAAVSFNPVVDYDGAGKTSLYHLTCGGKCYGDVYPWYDAQNHRLYMGFLWTDDARNGDYKNALELSDNLLTFTDVPESNNFDTWDFYRHNGRLHFVFDCNNFIDRTRYPYGVRDTMLYFDEENGRYLMVAGCYSVFDGTSQLSDLLLYASDDEMGLHWDTEGNAVAEGYVKNLPECPSLMKIGDRWYVFVSVAYRTAHQVGPLQYWVGDAGVDCMEVNWTEKEFRFLDGEDLCAARPVQVGDRVYLWGWIPATYDTMPWSPWGGYLNLPREVIRLPDGTLGSRIDPGLTKLLNYGNIYTLCAGNYTVAYGSARDTQTGIETAGETCVLLGDGYDRNFVTFTAKLPQDGSCGYRMRQGDREYRVLISRENGKCCLKVVSPEDPSHTVNSTLEIQDLYDGNFDVKLVIDREFVEFCVNDAYTLTAHTAMTGDSYSAGLYASADTAFSDVQINALRAYADIE